MKIQLFCLTLLIAMWLGSTEGLFAQAPPPPPPSPTLWSFLGIPQACYKVHAQLFNRRGNHPGLEKKPPLKGIADPANLKSDVPAIKAAAEIKQAEDLKPQKIKAIKYLATIGCGCYDKDEKVTKALLAAMDDCTEDVRLAAVEAVADAANSEYCAECKQRSCCNEKIVAQLSKIAYERDDEGCFVEPSERVRQAAIDAMAVCCSHYPGPEVAPVPPPSPIEGREQPAPIEGGDTEAAPVPPQPPVDLPENRSALNRETNSDDTRSVLHMTSSRRGAQHKAMIKSQIHSSDPPSQKAPKLAPLSDNSNPNPQAIAPVLTKVTGTVHDVNLPAGVITLRLNGHETLPPGTAVKVHHESLTGVTGVALLRVTTSRPGVAHAKPSHAPHSPKISRGDVFEAWR